MSHEVDSDLVRRLAALLEETGLGELEYATNDWKIRVARPTSTPVPPALSKLTNTNLPSSESDTEEAITKYQDDQILKSPMVGTAYLTPDPSSPPLLT